MLLYVREVKGERDGRLSDLIHEFKAKHVPVLLGSRRRIRNEFLRDVNRALTRMLRAFSDQLQPPRTASTVDNTTAMRDWQTRREAFAARGYPVEDAAEMAKIAAKLEGVARAIERQEASWWRRLREWRRERW